MARYSLRIKPSAARELETIGTKADRRRLIARIGRLAADPRPPGCMKLTRRALYRVRQGRYRIVYEVLDTELVVLVVRVADRRDAYAGL